MSKFNVFVCVCVDLCYRMLVIILELYEYCIVRYWYGIPETLAEE